MAKHKASTQVTVAPLFEKSALEQTLDRIKVPALGVIAVVVVWVLYTNLTRQAATREVDESWATFAGGTAPDPMTGLPSGSPEDLARLADGLKGKESGPWARLVQAQACLQDRDYDGALEAIARLRSEYPAHALVKDPQPLPDGSTATVADHLQAMAEAQRAWEAAHPELFNAPPVPEGSPKVRIETSAGAIEVALFQELAPKHVENFLKLCSEGFYDGTRFHRVLADLMIQGGDPNSRSEDRSTWGQGGADHTIPAEPNNRYHFAGVLSAAKKPGDVESSGSQFFITTQPSHHLDGQHTVFGSVVSGMEIVRAIGSAPLAEGKVDQPAEPVAILSTTVLP
jgi:cyclophilin family peptidyl-prolyl cis-trans isomerase